jgi:hypothetical protein
LAGLLGYTGPSPEAVGGIWIAALLYILSYYFVRVVLRVGLPEAERRKYITTGLGSYIMTFLFSWTLYNTLFLATLP